MTFISSFSQGYFFSGTELCSALMTLPGPQPRFTVPQNDDVPVVRPWLGLVIALTEADPIALLDFVSEVACQS